jgi:hypothetical protein
VLLQFRRLQPRQSVKLSGEPRKAAIGQSENVLELLFSAISHAILILTSLLTIYDLFEGAYHKAAILPRKTDNNGPALSFSEAI